MAHGVERKSVSQKNKTLDVSSYLR